MRLSSISHLNVNSKFLQQLVQSAQSALGWETNNLLILDFKESGALSSLDPHSKFPNDIRDFITHPLKKSDTQTSNLILADIPWNLRLASIGLSEKEYKYKNNAEYLVIKKSLELIAEEGIAFYLLPADFFSSKKSKDFYDELFEMGYLVSIVLNMPEDFLRPASSARPVLVGFQRGTWSDVLFVAETNYDTNFMELFNAFSRNEDTNNINIGTFVFNSEFTSFVNYKIQKQVKSINTGYKQFNPYKLNEIALDVLSTRETFSSRENAILIPRIGTSNPVSSFEKAHLKHQNYYYVVLDEKIVNAQYLEIYFNSELGKLSLESLKTFSFIPHLNKADLLHLSVPVPNLEAQTKIINTFFKLDQLKKEIYSLESELSLNPQNTEKLQRVATNALESLVEISDEEYVLRLVRTGETKEIEFKQTFNIDIITGKKEKFIQESALKNIVAFLNSNGGTLLIGVKDNDGEITGIETDEYQNDDKYSLNFKNSIKTRIGEKYYPFIEWEIVAVKNKKVLVVKCKESPIPCYLDDRDFYVRTNPSSDKLDGPRLVEYIQNHFKTK